MIRVLGHRELYRERRFHSAFPSIVRFRDDHLLLAFRRARDGFWLVPEQRRHEVDPLAQMDHVDARSQVMLMELDAAGERQLGGLDMLPPDPEAGDQYAALLRLPDDDLFVGSFAWYLLPRDVSAQLRGPVDDADARAPCMFLFWGSHASLRGRAAGVWRFDHAYLQPDGGFGSVLSPDGSKAVVGGVGITPLWRNGEILLAVYSGHAGCALFASPDRGRHWVHRAAIARDPDRVISYQEPALCDDGAGGVVCFMRTAGADGRLATTHSGDGLDWAPPRLHRVVGHPFHPLMLRDGRVLLSYGYRDAPYGIRVRLLAHPLRDPDDAVEVVVRDDGVCPDVGYPWAVELADGRILLTYYWTDPSGCRHIVGSHLEVADP